MKAAFAIIGAGLVMILDGCVSLPQAPVTTAVVGPNPVALRSTSVQGELEVFSRLAKRTDDQNLESTLPVWYQHSDYYLCDGNGKSLRHVFNAAGHYNSDPKIIRLPAGQYLVKAQAAPNARVEVPVIIKSGEITRVHLDGSWRPPGFAAKSQVVTLPDGRPIGWGM